MIGAGGGEQQRLGFGLHRRLAVEQQLADRLGAGAAAGLAGFDTPPCPRARSAAASARTWVDLPTPSPPSRLMNCPVRVTPCR